LNVPHHISRVNPNVLAPSHIKERLTEQFLVRSESLPARSL
jgi:hypothetical protein